MLFTILRIFEILTLIPVWGILAYFVDRIISTNATARVPDEVLVLFIVSILATAWAILTLITYRRMQWTPLYVVFLDMGFFGALIAGVVILAPWVRFTDCISVTAQWDGLYLQNGSITGNRHCIMYKVAWALGIINVILFFLSALAGWRVWHRTGVVVVEERPRRRSRHERRGSHGRHHHGRPRW